MSSCTTLSIICSVTPTVDSPLALSEQLFTSSPHLLLVHHQNYVTAHEMMILYNIFRRFCFYQGLSGLPGDQGLIGQDGPQVGEAFSGKPTQFQNSDCSIMNCDNVYVLHYVFSGKNI